MRINSLVSFWQTKIGAKQYSRGQKLEQLLSEGKTLEEAMREVGLKTKYAALSNIRVYRNAKESEIQRGILSAFSREHTEAPIKDIKELLSYLERDHVAGSAIPPGYLQSAHVVRSWLYDAAKPRVGTQNEPDVLLPGNITSERAACNHINFVQHGMVAYCLDCGDKITPRRTYFD